MLKEAIRGTSIDYDSWDSRSAIAQLLALFRNRALMPCSALLRNSEEYEP